MLSLICIILAFTFVDLGSWLQLRMNDDFKKVHSLPASPKLLGLTFSLIPLNCGLRAEAAVALRLTRARTVYHPLVLTNNLNSS
ncbi:hypothetical protein BDV19DRAFT_66464 [Aspergillus venezuelensis]